jgi:lipopolysaccharide/colanic/teichoic acid biosynthesis glycosyltransferase
MQTNKPDTAINIKNSEYQLTAIENAYPNLKKRSNFIINTLVALAIYLVTFFIWYYFKRGTFLLEDKYVVLMIYYIVSLFVASVLSNKAFLTRKHVYIQSLRKIYISIFLALGMISLILLETDASTLSRYVIIGSILSGSVLESFYFYAISENKSIKLIIDRNPISYIYTIPDLLLLSLSIYFFIIRNIGIENLNERHVLTLVLIYLSWNYSALFTHRFNPIMQSLNNWSATGLQVKFYLLILSSTSLFLFAVNIRAEYWPFFLQSVAVYSAISFVIFLFLHVHKLPYPTDEVTNVFLKAFELGKPAITEHKTSYQGKYSFVSSDIREPVVKQKMQLQYFKDFPEVFNFLEREIELQSFDVRKTLVIRSSDFYNVEVLSENSVELFVNLHEINDLKRVNDYFRLLNEKMNQHGIYAGCLIPIKNRYKIFQKKYPFFIANVFYFFDFIWRRVFPKVPGLRKFYFTLTKGRDRSISLAEGLGRLVYCGFEIVDLTEINEYVFFVSKKVKEPSTDRNPSYSPIFKMKRIGRDGKQIYVYKIRTMHPYSEYLQEFVYSTNSLTDGGKFKDDFRISSWGRVFRKLWIDELPMLINLFRGEIKLVGVRPVSNHYLSLYSKEFQERRQKYKPGLVPPFYADMPKSIEEIEASEKKYFDLFDHSPFITDVKYFFKIIFNILFHRRTSA